MAGIDPVRRTAGVTMRGAGHVGIAAGLAFLLLAAAAVWTFGPLGRSLRRAPAEVRVEARDDTGRKAGVGERVSAAIPWSEPGGDLSRAFDLFTPPVVYLDAQTGVPSLAADAPDPAVLREPGDGLELVGIRKAVYPLQLVGHAGSGRTARGVFEFTDTGETTLAAAGRHFTELGLTLQSFEVRRARGGVPVTATARLVNELSGEEVVLTSLERKTLGPPLAVFRVITSGREIECPEGGSFETSGVTCEVARISTDPPGVEVRFAKVDGSGAVSRILRPVPGLR